MLIEILNWEKYNPRADAKGGWSWWRFQADFFEDPEFYELPGPYLLIWIAICCARAKAGILTGSFRVNEKQIADRAKTSITIVRSAIGHFRAINKLKILEKSDPVLDTYVHVRPRTDPCSTDETDGTYVRDETSPGSDVRPVMSPADASDADHLPKSKLTFSEPDMKLAAWFQKAIAANNPKARRVHRANLKQWADVFRLMREQDGLAHEEIGDVVCWLFDPEHPDYEVDPFWRTVIQSPTKFREKWDTLSAKRHTPKKAPGFR